ncbi:cohesin domain-containing protein [Paenibacillus terrigena]|uniref:DUF7402 domain-containing protein n=1 Tax=Paenibacillus terrigena TaxID=369333 RepID=UPI0028D3C0BA|nr:cohesin domain-containing protein [Paenibacillus terrigena]
MLCQRIKSKRIIIVFILGLMLLIPNPTTTKASEIDQQYPAYTFSYPRELQYGSSVNEPLVTNGVISSFLVNNGNDSYYPGQLKLIMAPPYLLNNNNNATLFAWGYDDSGYFETIDKKFTMDYSLAGLTSHIDSAQSGSKNWKIDINYQPIPNKRMIVANYSYTNVDTKNHALKIAASLQNPQITKSVTGWSWDNPGTGKINASYDPNIGSGAIISNSTSNDAYLAFGLNVPVSSYSVTTNNEYSTWNSSGGFTNSPSVSNVASHFQYLSHSFGNIAPGQTVKMSAILSIGGTQSEAQTNYLDIYNNLDSQLDQAIHYWNKHWTNSNYEVVTPDPAINRMSNLAHTTSLLSLDNLNDTWFTGFGNNARGVTYLWDTNYTRNGIIKTNSPIVKGTLIKLLNLNLTGNYAYRITDQASLGAYYAYNQFVITQLVYTYVTNTGDSAFLNQEVKGNNTVIDVLNNQINYVHSTLKYDFGEGGNLLEVVPHYVHRVPDLTADTYWMANKIKAMAQKAGRTDIASSMDNIASTALSKTQALWDPTTNWFKTGEGNLVYTTQIFNMIPTGAITQEQITGLLKRKNDFIFNYGTKSLASFDVDYKSSGARGDWDGPGNYIGNIGDMVEDLAYAGDKDALFNLAKGISNWWKWRPVQPQGIEATTGKGIGSIANSTISTSGRYSEVVPNYLLGLIPKLGGMDVDTFNTYPTDWINSLGTVSFLGKQYSAKVSIPYNGHKYSFYVDKPDKESNSFQYATIYSSNGSFMQDWYSQRLSTWADDVNAVLHFGTEKPIIKDADEVTAVSSANKNTFTINNSVSDIKFTTAITTAASNNVTFNVKAKPNTSYTVNKDGADYGGPILSDAAGNFQFTYNGDFTSEHSFHIFHPAKVTNVALNTPVTGVTIGTAKTASTLGLPKQVALVTDVGNVYAIVTWDLNNVSYDPTAKKSQTFTVPGTVALPFGVVNPNNVPLTTSINVTVNKIPASTATVTASSSFNANYSPEKVVDSIIGQSDKGEWASRGELNPWIQLNWATSQTFNKITFYDRPNLVDWAPGGTLTFSDGSTLTVSGIPNDGSAYSVTFPDKTVTWVKFQVSGGNGQNVGLSEIEFYDEPVASQSTLTGLQQVIPGQTFDVSMGLSGVTQSVYQQMYAQDLTLHYDPANLQFDSVISLKDGFQVIDQKENVPGQVRIVAASLGNQGVLPQGDLLKIKFTVKSSAQSTAMTIDVDHVAIANGQGNELQLGGASHGIHIHVPVDKSALNALIASAQAKYDAAVEGNEDGLYAIGSKAQLQSAIITAQATANDPNAAQQQVDRAMTALEAAIQVFETKKINADVNGSGDVTIGDLAVVAAAYGKQQDQAGWNAKADVNRDGKVDIVDLAIVAKAILK